MRTKAESQDQLKSRAFNTKGYFHRIEPYCEEYLKAKHESYEKTKKLR